MSNLLDWEAIYGWAEQKPPDTVLGESCTNSLCPLATYLNETTGSEHWSVGPSIINTGTNERLDMSAWVKTLIERVDQATGNTRGDVSREQFLRLMERLRDIPGYTFS